MIRKSSSMVVIAETDLVKVKIEVYVPVNKLKGLEFDSSEAISIAKEKLSKEVNDKLGKVFEGIHIGDGEFGLENEKEAVYYFDLIGQADLVKEVSNKLFNEEEALPFIEEASMKKEAEGQPKFKVGDEVTISIYIDEENKVEDGKVVDYKDGLYTVDISAPGEEGSMVIPTVEESEMVKRGEDFPVDASLHKSAFKVTVDSEELEYDTPEEFLEAFDLIIDGGFEVGPYYEGDKKEWVPFFIGNVSDSSAGILSFVYRGSYFGSREEALQYIKGHAQEIVNDLTGQKENIKPEKEETNMEKKSSWTKQAEENLEKLVLDESAGDEDKAIKDYTRRKDESSDPKVKELFDHVIDQEKEHKKEFEEGKIIESEMNVEAENTCPICSTKFSTWPEYNEHRTKQHKHSSLTKVAKAKFKKGDSVKYMDSAKHWNEGVIILVLPKYARSKEPIYSVQFEDGAIEEFGESWLTLVSSGSVKHSSQKKWTRVALADEVAVNGGYYSVEPTEDHYKVLFHGNDGTVLKDPEKFTNKDDAKKKMEYRTKFIGKKDMDKTGNGIISKNALPVEAEDKSKCVVCGKKIPFEGDIEHGIRTCSHECQIELVNNQIRKEQKNKKASWTKVAQAPLMGENASKESDYRLWLYQNAEGLVKGSFEDAKRKSLSAGFPENVVDKVLSDLKEFFSMSNQSSLDFQKKVSAAGQPKEGLRTIEYTRKPATWSEIEKIEQRFYDYLKDEIENLPIIRAEDIELKEPMDTPKGPGLPQFFILTKGNIRYLVNTEGFNYCRYMTELPPKSSTEASMKKEASYELEYLKKKLTELDKSGKGVASQDHARLLDKEIKDIKKQIEKLEKQDPSKEKDEEIKQVEKDVAKLEKDQKADVDKTVSELQKKSSIKKEAKYNEAYREADKAGSPWTLDKDKKKIIKKNIEVPKEAVASRIKRLEDGNYRYALNQSVLYDDGYQMRQGTVSNRTKVGNKVFYDVTEGNNTFRTEEAYLENDPYVNHA